MNCGSKDPLYPLQADIFYPEITQSAYGNAVKSWTKDSTLLCSLGPAGSRFKEELTPNVEISLDSLLVGRFKKDIRFSGDEDGNALTNILITNIKDRNCKDIYIESSGARKGKPTLFEVATVTPHVGAFGKVEYYKVIIRRSENQGEDV
jgi:hypothetical protein